MGTIRQIEPEATGTIWPAGHYGESRTVIIDTVEYVLGAGTSDVWSIYETPYGTAVITTNSRMGYVGVELLDPDHHETEREGERTVLRARSVYFNQNTAPGDIGPRDTLEYADATILRRVLEGIY